MLVAQNQDLATGIAVDSSGVYWANEGALVGSTGSIGYAPLDGGPAALITAGQNRPHSVALDAKYVYFTSFGNGDVLRVAK